MMYILSMIILIFFAIIGLCSFISAVINAAHNAGGKILVITKGMSEDNAEATIRKAARICMSTKGAELICIADSNSKADKICRMMAQDYPFIKIKDKEELINMITEQASNDTAM